MIRLTFLWIFIGYLGITATKDWYRSLCGLILLMAVIEHPDMPKTIMGIQGLNPWNLLFLIVVITWMTQRGHEGLKWDMPGKVNRQLILYSVVIVIAFLRMILDFGGYEDLMELRDLSAPSTANLVSEHLVNAFKWVIPGMLLFDGCRDEKRLRMGMICLLAVYFLLAVQVIRWMPLGNIAGGDELSDRSLKILMNEVGFHRVNMSMMLAGASWAVFASRHFIAEKFRFWLLMACITIFFAQMLTGGRMGYVTWALVGLVLLWCRWRRYLLLVPVMAAVILMFVPGAWERMTEGFTPESSVASSRLAKAGYLSDEDVDLYSVTSGRNIAWPLVIEKIKEAPFIGYGKEAMVRTGLTSYMLTEYSESFPHPHNAYLQLFLDNGIIGAFCILPFYWLVLKYSYSLFKDNRRIEFIAVGGCCLALVLALLIASIGSQTFYPREGAVGMWCAIGLMLRVYIQRSQLPEGYVESVEGGEEDVLWRRM